MNKPTLRFEEYLSVGSDGSLWWRLVDAVKLGAGYVPAGRDGNLLPVSAEQVASMRTLLAQFGRGRGGPGRPVPRVVEGERYVEAKAFLLWLKGYCQRSGNDVDFPSTLMIAVANALNAAAELGLANTDELQRQVADEQSDVERDPAALRDLQRSWDAGVRQVELERAIAEWSTTACNTASELVLRETRLAELRRELAALRASDPPSGTTKRERTVVSAESQPTRKKEQYLPYLRALALWRDKYEATPEEVAAWVYFGPQAGGIAAFKNANELHPPPRFSYDDATLPFNKEWDYVAPLMSCWFRQDDVHAFDPSSRFVTGATLLERWAKVPGIRVEAFVAAKVRESALLDIHPIMHSTQATEVGNEAYPSMTSALFELAHVELIELTEFGWSKAAVTAAGTMVSGVTGSQIAAAFAVMRDQSANLKWWRERMSDAKRTGLDACRVGPVRAGRKPGTLWRPDLVAGWLLQRKPQHRGGMAASAIRRSLLSFADCQTAAEMLFPSNE